MTQLNKKVSAIIILFAALLLSLQSKAQKVDTISTFSITGYLDAYYAYYSDSVGPGNFQKFPTVSPRSNNPSLNIAQLSFQYNAEKIRGAAVFHFGDIAAATWAPAPYNNIMEAHVGFKVCRMLWIDAGFFRTHFGTEFLLPVENIASSLTIGTFYEQLYQSGIRLNFTPIKELEINLFLTNGYNTFVDNNNKKSLGMAVTYTIDNNASIGYTNYTGDDTPPGKINNHLRVQQNLFFNFQRNRIKLQVGGDFCLQQNSDLATGSETASMYSALATFRYQVAKHCAVYARGEVFSDPDGFMSTIIKDYAGNQTGYKVWGITAGAEYKPTENSYIRIEGRRLQMDQDQYIFTHDGLLYNYRYEVMINAGVTFDLLKNIRTRINGDSQQPGSGAVEE
ncbi:MAG: outer membrane beta-barrel protein [Chitinophagales bacterium]